MTDIIQSLTGFSRLRQGLEALASQAQRTSRVMFMLGPFMFSRDTAAPQSIRRSSEFTWTAQNRFGRDPALQFTGPGADSIELEGDIYPTYKGGLSQVAAMRELAGTGKPHILVDGRGNVYGQWVIMRVEETGRILFDNGTPRKIQFRVSLRLYGENKKGEGDGLFGLSI